MTIETLAEAIHCSQCHGNFDPEQHPDVAWIYSEDSDDPKFVGLGLCHLCNTDSRPDYEWDLFHEYFLGCEFSHCVALDDEHPYQQA